MELTRQRLAELARMDDDLYDRQLHDGLITAEENAACTAWLKARCERIEKENARWDREKAQRQEIDRRLAHDYQTELIDAEMELSDLQDQHRRLKAQNRELLIDHGVEAANRGEDPIEAMKELALRAAMFGES